MSFNLHSRSNRRIYPKEKYPLTHWIDRRNEFFRRDKPKPLRDTNDFDLFVFLCFGFLLWIVFNFSIHFYNVSYGPFHFTLSEFVREIENFDRQSFIWRKIYFQVEFDENKSLNSSTWITLPMKNIKSVHHRFPLDFHSFSNSTLRCFIEKISKENLSEISADSIRFIDKIYQRSRTKFTHSILSDCGIFIGFIYKTMSQSIVSCFIPSRFRPDYFLSQTKAFCCLEFFLCFSLFCYIWMLLTPFIDLTHFLFDWVSSLLYRYGIYSYPLEFCDDIQKELSILNLNLSLTEQILVLDRSIQQAEFRWENLLFVIQIDEKNRYVVMLHEDLDRLLYSFWATSPFKICHVDQIEEIYFHEGIFWGNNHSWISWTFNPNRFTENHAYWLHSILMEISDVYRQRYENSLERQRSPVWTDDDDEEFFVETNDNSGTPASTQFIERFRQDNFNEKKICDEQMSKEEILCSICFGNVRLNDQFAQWPCQSTVQHLFHFDCMEMYINVRNLCPVCRSPVESMNDVTENDWLFDS